MEGNENNYHSSWTIDAQDRVCAVEFSPFSWSSSIMAIGTTKNIIIVQCKFTDEHPDLEDFTYDVLREFSFNSRVEAIAWSPETLIALAPKVIRLATSGADNNIHLITSNLKNEDSSMLFEGHIDHINSITFEPEHGSQLASTSDDQTCRIWDLDGTTKTCFTLKSAGTAVCWHKEDRGKIMVAQKNGIIRFYNISSRQPIMSLECGHSPLTSAEWCPGNNLRVGAAAGSSWFVWDISRSSHPHDSSKAHTDGALVFRWSRNNANLFVTTGRPKHDIKVLHYTQNQVKFAHTLPVGSGVSWHSRLGVLAAIGDRKVHLWKIDIL